MKNLFCFIIILKNNILKIITKSFFHFNDWLTSTFGIDWGYIEKDEND